MSDVLRSLAAAAGLPKAAVAGGPALAVLLPLAGAALAAVLLVGLARRFYTYCRVMYFLGKVSSFSLGTDGWAGRDGHTQQEKKTRPPPG